MGFWSGFVKLRDADFCECAEGGSFEVVRAVVRNPATLDLIHIQNDANRYSESERIEPGNWGETGETLAKGCCQLPAPTHWSGLCRFIRSPFSSSNRLISA
jgi:hypothetical protein